MFRDLLKLNDTLRASALKKGILENPDAGIDLNTAEQSQDEQASRGDSWVSKITSLMEGADFGETPREMILPQFLKLYLSKVDDGIYSGFVKKEDPAAGDNGEVQTNIMKLTPEAIVQALKAKGYLPRELAGAKPTESKPSGSNDYMGLYDALKRFKGELHLHLEKGYEDLNSVLLKANEFPEAFPVGTVREWSTGIRAVKHHDGWVVLGDKNHGKLLGKFSEDATHTDYADVHHDDKPALEKPETPEPGSMKDHIHRVAEGLYQSATPVIDVKKALEYLTLSLTLRKLL